MAEAVRISAAVLDAIASHARATLPDECCGLLVGGGSRIVRAVPARNLTPSPTRYQIDPADHFAAIRAARADGLAVVGAYHSHPGARPVPSRRDLDDACFPDFVYLIVSVGAAGTHEGAGAYHLAATGATPLELLIEP